MTGVQTCALPISQPVAIRAERLTKTFAARPIVRNVSFTLPAGETLALLGPNGAGKSTLLRMLAALSRPTSGQITLAGYDLDAEANAARRSIGYVGHSLSLYDELTARENLLFYGRMYGVQNGAERADALLASVGLKTRANERARNLSRGQQQRLALARALLHDPAALLLDEPDTGLDDEAITLLGAILAERRARGQTTVLTTHNLERGLRLSDRTLVLLGGRVAHDGASEALTAEDIRALYATQRRVVAKTATAVSVGASGGRPLTPDTKDAPDVAPETGGARLFWRQIAAIVAKDLRIELRTRQAWMAMGLFALLALVVFNFAFDLRVTNQAAVGPGALWVAFIFASLLGLGRNIAAEQERGPLDRLLICPVDRQALYLAKVIGNVIVIGAVEIVALPVFAALYNLPLLVGMILPITLLGTIGVATIGTLFAALAASTRARELLLPLLIFPLILPVVIASVRATEGLISPLHGDAPWLGLLIAFDVIFLSLATLTFQYVVEE